MKRLKFDMYLYGTEVYVIVVWFVAMLGGLYTPDILCAKYGMELSVYGWHVGKVRYESQVWNKIWIEIHYHVLSKSFQVEHVYIVQYSVCVGEA